MAPTDQADQPPSAPSHGERRVSRLGELRAVREFISDCARAAGLLAHRCEQLALAVSEVVANAIEHGGGTATVLTHIDDQAVTVDIHDQSDTPIPTPRAAPPAAPESRGRGLWLAAQLCDRVEINRGSGGNFIRLVMTL